MTREKDMAKGDIRAVAEEEFAIGAPHSDHSSHGALGTCRMAACRNQQSHFHSLIQNSNSSTSRYKLFYHFQGKEDKEVMGKSFRGKKVQKKPKSAWTVMQFWHNDDFI